MNKDSALIINSLIPDLMSIPVSSLLVHDFLMKKKKKKKQKIEKKYSLSEIVLYLLYAGQNKPIHGRISITKQVFLLIKEVLGEKNCADAKFVPYLYGPYSFHLTQLIASLEYDGLIERTGKKNTKNEKFYLTKNGKNITESKFAKLPKKLQQEIIRNRKGWDEDHVEGLLRYVYAKYPKYTEKSKIRERYKSVNWGKSRG